MKKIMTFFLLFLFKFLFTSAQNVGIGTISPNSSSILEVTSSSKGILIPRMTSAQKRAIVNPVNGLMVFQTDSIGGFYFYSDNKWLNLKTSATAQSNKLLIYTGQAFATINSDGSGLTTIPITLPTNVTIRGTKPTAVVSPDGSRFFFEAYEQINGVWQYYIYSCDINGSNLTLVYSTTDPGSGLKGSY